MKAKVDYDALEREYITSKLSIRSLAAKHDVAWSAVADHARRKDAAGKTWVDKRGEFRAKTSAKTMERDVTKYAANVEEIEFEMIQAARAVIFKVLEGLRDGSIVPQPRDMLMAIDKLNLLTGRPTARTEETIVGIASAAPITDPDFLRRLEELTRGVSNESERAPRLRIEGSKPN